MRVFTALLLLFGLVSGCSIPITPDSCSDNWKVTGFYTPVESDFNINLNRHIKIRQSNMSLFNANFNHDFLNEVRIEGWGRTRFGWYLGYYNRQWHKRKSALNALGKPLKLGAVAVDNTVIKKGLKVKIPAIENIMKMTDFFAVDVGSAVKKQHVDVYTGEGSAAKKLSYRVTGRHQVCVATSNLAPVETLSIR